jgi:ArsR family transcriptional regulator
MDSAALLDLLGNANRRRILRLLSSKPCYVTEISESLEVSPKAVIDHLDKLEAAGLVESRTDDGRRKYYYISRNLRLEVNVSPYDFGAKSAYPASNRLDITAWRHLSIDLGSDESSDVADLARQLRRLEALEQELSMAQRWAQGRLADVMEQLSERFERRETQLYGQVLRTLADDAADTRTLVDATGAPRAVVVEAMEELADRGVVVREDGQWRLAEE